jgi:hypothetical protein
MPRNKGEFTTLPIIAEEDEKLDNNGNSLLDNNNKLRNSNTSSQKFSNEEFFKVVKFHERKDVKKKKWSSSGTLCLWSVFIALCAVFLLFIAAIIEGRGLASSIYVQPELFTLHFSDKALSMSQESGDASFLPTFSISSSFKVRNDLPFIVEVGSADFDLSYALVKESPQYKYIGNSRLHSTIVSRNQHRLAHISTDLDSVLSLKESSEIQQSLWKNNLRFRIQGKLPVFAKILFVKIPYIKHINCSFSYAYHPPVPTDIQC